MRYHEQETTVAADGSIRLEHAPFPAGHRVRLMVVDLDGSGRVEPTYPLRGTPYRADADAFDGPADDLPTAKRSIQEVQRLLAGTVLRYGDPFGSAFTDEELDLMENGPLFPDEPAE